MCSCNQVAAASASKKPAAVTTVVRTPAVGPAPARRREHNVSPSASAHAPAPYQAVTPIVPIIASTPPAGKPPLSTATEPARPGPLAETKVVEGLTTLTHETKPPPNLVVNGSSSGNAERTGKTGNGQPPSDDNSQRADSNSELGTKPPSLDGKSITSGTTFALDEKESLRPDDSASVKAAAEDDDSFSIRGSYMANSRMGSEVAARIHRLQIGDMPPRTISAHVHAGPQSQGVDTPQSGVSEKQAIIDPKLPLASGQSAPDALAANGFLSKNPDEKLLEAMQSSKDRIFLLRLEQQVIEFVQGSE